MTMRPAWLMVALFAAFILHAAAFMLLSLREERGVAETGDEGILVSLGTPSDIGAGGASNVDQSVEEEIEQETEIEAEAESETEAVAEQATEAENAHDDQTVPVAPNDIVSDQIATDESALVDEAASEPPVEPIPTEAVQEVETEPNSAPLDETIPVETVQDEVLPNSEQVEEIAEDPTLAEPEISEPASTEPAQTAEPMQPEETKRTAMPLPQFRPPQPEDEARRRRAVTRSRQAETPTRRSSGAAASGNSQRESDNARTGGGNAAEQADYLSRLHAQLVGAKRYPRSARAAGIEGVAQISMTINREGRITAFRITRSSGHQVLDQEINNMVSRVQPLPRMPASMPQRQISINMAVRFKLD